MMVPVTSSGALGSFAGQGVTANTSHPYCLWILTSYGNRPLFLELQPSLDLHCFTVSLSINM